MASPAARRLLDAEVGVERHHLHLGQRVLVRVQEVEARLHEGPVGVGEERPHAGPQEVGRRHVVDVEDREEIVRRLLHRLVQGTALEAAAVGALQGDDVEALGAQLGHHGARQLGGLVGAVVEHLDVQLVARPVEPGSRLDSAAQYRPLVERRDLHDHVRQLGIAGQRRRQQLFLAAQPLLLQPVMQHHHVEQAADEGGQQQAAGGEDDQQQHRKRVDDGHQVPAFGVRLNSLLRPSAAATMAPVLATAR